MKKKILTILSFVMVAAIAIVGTIAYLTDTDSDINVMTVGNVKITQNEQQRVEADGEFTSTLEDFDQNKILLPVTYDRNATDDEVKIGDYTLKLSDKENNYVDKIISVTNDSSIPVYVRTLVAVPTGGSDWEPVPVNANDCWLHWNIPAGYNTYWNLNNTPTLVEIDGVNYYVWEFTHKEPVKAGKTTFPMVRGFYMDKKVDNDDNGYYITYENGTTKRINNFQDASGNVDILVLSQAVQADGFKDSSAAFDEAFGEVDANAVIWFGGVLAENSNRVEIPEDATAVSNFEEFKNALAVGGNYEINAPFTVEGILSVSADTAFYNADPANVITFAENARLKTAENADLALYGIKIDGGGSFEMIDGELYRDTDKTINDDAILMASAGSTLTLGQGTVIENVVSQSPAVAWAKGTVDNRATIIFDGATVRNCSGGTGTVINVDRYGDVYIEEGTVITGNVSFNAQNHGIIRIYNDNWDAANASTLTISGGELTNNYFSANGMIGLYYAKMTMNGGKISGNSWYSYNGKTNGFYSVVYVHSNAQFIMNGGEISGNTITDGAINAINSSVVGAITFNGGTVTNNSNTRNDNKDALAAVCYPYSMQKTLAISKNANVTGTVYNHAIEGDVVVRNYSEISEYFGE